MDQGCGSVEDFLPVKYEDPGSTSWTKTKLSCCGLYVTVRMELCFQEFISLHAAVLGPHRHICMRFQRGKWSEGPDALKPRTFRDRQSPADFHSAPLDLRQSLLCETCWSTVTSDLALHPSQWQHRGRCHEKPITFHKCPTQHIPQPAPAEFALNGFLSMEANRGLENDVCLDTKITSFAVVFAH